MVSYLYFLMAFLLYILTQLLMQCVRYEELPFEKLFEIAEEKYELMEYEEAQYFYSLAFSKNPTNDMVVLCFGHCLKKNQKIEEAKTLLQESIKCNPAGSYKRYFELGEIYEGVASIVLFEKGIEQAKKGLKNPFLLETPEKDVKRDMAQAYASIAEVCMTDLLSEKQAESKCLQALRKGKECDDTCMDVHLQIGNYLLFKENQEEARTELVGIYTNILAEKEEYQEELILTTGKYLIELNEHAKSMELFEQLHEQQSNESEVVYLLAFCAFTLGKYGECEDYLEEYAIDRKDMEIDEQIDSAVEQLKVELAKKKGEDTGEEEWMDVEDEEDDQ